MIELDTANRLSDQLRKATDGLDTKLGGGLIGDPTISPNSVQQVVLTDQSSADLSNAVFVRSIREQLEQHPYFRGRAFLVTIELLEGTVVLSGRLPSHHLKQILQEAIKGMLGVVDIDNQVDVVWPNYVSRAARRVLCKTYMQLLG